MAEKNNNPFKEINKSLIDVPPHLKKKVMSDVANAKLVMDLVSLFTTNYMSAIEGMLKTNPKTN